MDKFDRLQGTVTQETFDCKSSLPMRYILCIEGTTSNHWQLSSVTSDSNDPIISNLNSSSLSSSEQLTVTDLNLADMSYVHNDMLCSPSPYANFAFPYYSSTSNNLQTNRDDHAESGYSTPSKSHCSTKKTVYEVVV
jgi:hypothetical protein